jgi:hypothetical protein
LQRVGPVAYQARNPKPCTPLRQNPPQRLHPPLPKPCNHNNPNPLPRPWLRSVKIRNSSPAAPPTAPRPAVCQPGASASPARKLGMLQIASQLRWRVFV